MNNTLLCACYIQLITSKFILPCQLFVNGSLNLLNIFLAKRYVVKLRAEGIGDILGRGFVPSSHALT